MGRGGPIAQGGRHPHELIPLFPDEPDIDGALEDRVETAIVLGAVQFIERLFTDREAWHQAITQQMTEPKELLRLYMDSQDSHAGQGRARPIEPYQPQRDVPPSPWLPVRASHPAAVRGWPPCEHAHRLACFPERHTGPLGIVLGPLKPTSVHRDSHQTHHSWTTTSY